MSARRAAASGAGATGAGATGTLEHGDRDWQAAGRETVDDLTSLVRQRAKGVRDGVGVDAVHDMRTAIRRLRTAITLHGDAAPKKERVTVEDELKRVARRLGTVRDLDVLLETLDAHAAAGRARNHDGTEPLRDAWRTEREAGAERLTEELGRPRFSDALRDAKRLARPRRDGAQNGDPGAGAETERVATQAPGRIWDAFGAVLAYQVDPKTADPDVIHQLRIAAKKLRYTLEAFQDALDPGASLIADVTALQDAAGSMHDGIVAAQRARSTVAPLRLTKRQRAAVEAYADGQVQAAEGLRPAVARSLRRVRSRAFRESLGRAVAGMGHVGAG